MFESNDREFLASLRAELPKRRVHVGVLDNVAPYAVFLDAREGYRVVNEQVLGEEADRAVAAAIQDPDASLDEAVPDALERGLDATVAVFHSEIAATQPPLRAGGPARPRHGGGLEWADRSTELASSYRSHVNERPQREHPYTGVEFEERRRPRRLRRTRDER